MTPDVRRQLVAQLDAVLSDYDVLPRPTAESGDFDDPSIRELLVRGRAAIERIAGVGSAYHKQALALDGMGVPGSAFAWLRHVIPAVRALRTDLDAGYLSRLSEMFHAELFSDYLEMADHLRREGYKDPAAVIAGSSLEVHLRALCAKHDVTVEEAGRDGPKAKKADRLNADLAAKGAYNKLDQKNVTAWLDLRNSAAHGKYAEFNAEQVRLLIDEVRAFISRHPA